MALNDVAFHRSKQCQLLFGFDTFGNHLQTDGLGQPDDRADDSLALPALGNAADKAAIDLQLMHREAFQVRQAGVPHPEVVQRDPHACR